MMQINLPGVKCFPVSECGVIVITHIVSVFASLAQTRGVKCLSTTTSPKTGLGLQFTEDHVTRRKNTL